MILTFNLFCSVPCFSQDEQALLTAIDEAGEAGDTTDIIRAWYALGKYYDGVQQMDNSNAALKRAADLALVHENYIAYGTVANYLASNFSQVGESDSAIMHYSKAAEAFSAVPDSARLAFVLVNLGDMYASKGDFVKAAELGFQAVRIKEAAKDSSNLAFVYQKVGEIFKLAGEHDKWEDYVHKAYGLISLEGCASISSIVSIFNDLGGIAEMQGHYEKALQYYDTLIHIANGQDLGSAKGVALHNCAMVYKKMGNLTKALDAAIESQLYDKPTAYHVITNNNLLAELYFALGDLRRSRQFAMQSIGDDNIERYPEEKMRTVRMLYQMEKALGNFKEALSWMEAFKVLSDKIRDKELRSSILDMELAYQTEKREAQIALLTAENVIKEQRIRTGFMILIVLFLVVVLILYILYIRRKQTLLIQNDLQQKVLRSQMNPHFIFNVLGSIQSFMKQDETGKASAYLSRFASLIRFTLEHAASESISLDLEIAMLKNYIELEQMRMPDKFYYTIEMQDIEDPEFVLIPPMLIQPFIENAIKHGFRQIDYQGNLSIKITERAHVVEVEIADNGPGMRQHTQQSQAHHSMAMEIFNKRRKLIQQKLNRDFGFRVENRREIEGEGETGVIVSLKIPVLN